MKRKILVTGGAGYLGAILVPKLLAEGNEVIVLDNFMYKQNSLLDCCASEDFQVVRGDCRDEKLIQKLLKDVDAIIPLAAIVGAPACKIDEMAAKSVNYESILTLLKYRSNEQQLIYPTTNSGYGIGEQGKFCTEETPLNPLSLYGVTKVDAEKAVLDAENTITFRLATVFGMSPRMRTDLLVNDFVYRATMDSAVIVFEGHAKRNYIHIRDVARAFLHALDNGAKMKGHAYNVGLSNANLSKLELCAEIKKQVPKFVYLEAPIGEDPDKRDYIISNEKLESTGFAPLYFLPMGIAELIKGYSVIRNQTYANI